MFLKKIKVFDYLTTFFVGIEMIKILFEAKVGWSPMI